MKLSSESTEYLAVRVSSNFTLDDQVVKVAVIRADEQPTETTVWTTAAWVGEPSQRRVARVLVGPDGVRSFVADDYDVWVKVTDFPEIPVFPAGRLSVI